MRKIKMMIACLSMLGLVAACGEGFKAVKLDNSSVAGNIADTNNAAVIETEAAVEEVGETPLSVDQSILNSYSADFNNISDQLLTQLGNEIKAFEVNITSSMSSANVNIEAKVNLSCNNQLVFRVGGINFAQLTSGSKVSLGFQGVYNVRLQCAGSDCSEMVAAITKSNTHTDVTVLLGLQEAGNTSSGNSATTRYISRRVQISPQFVSRVDSVLFYTQRCGFEAQRATGLPTGSGTAIDPTAGGTSTSVVNPVAPTTAPIIWNHSTGPL